MKQFVHEGYSQLAYLTGLFLCGKEKLLIQDVSYTPRTLVHFTYSKDNQPAMYLLLNVTMADLYLRMSVIVTSDKTQGLWLLVNSEHKPKAHYVITPKGDVFLDSVAYSGMIGHVSTVSSTIVASCLAHYLGA